MVTQAGEPLLLAVPLGAGLAARELLLELAAILYQYERISLGLAAKIAGLTDSEMIDELGRREIAVIRVRPGEMEQ